MLIKYDHLTDLPVFTKSGVKLGKIFDLEIDIDSHAVFQYIVRTSFVSRTSYLIKPAQVLSIDEKRLVVDDGVMKEVKKEVQRGLSPGMQPQPMIETILPSERE